MPKPRVRRRSPSPTIERCPAPIIAGLAKYVKSTSGSGWCPNSSPIGEHPERPAVVRALQVVDDSCGVSAARGAFSRQRLTLDQEVWS